MAQLTRITSHETEALARLLRQFRGKAKWFALIGALSRQCRDVENGLWQQYTETIDTAVGVGLDYFGILAGYRRNAVPGDTSEDDDEVYRDRVKAKFLVNSSGGSVHDIWNILDVLFEGAYSQVYTEGYPAGFEWSLGESQVIDSVTRNLAVKFIGWAKPVGVRANFKFQYSADEDCFSFFDGPGLGFGDTGDPTAGGNFAGARACY